jgi:uncharacterized protein YndB with AHSA1/START domain
MSQTTSNSRIINASPEKIFNALTTPKALESWRAPGDMIAKVHWFDPRRGGGYQMSLFYPSSERQMKGKTARKEDRFTSRFLELDPPHKITEAITFETTDPNLSGEMIMEVTLEPTAAGTKVTFLFSNIPPGIRPQDNEKGTLSSLEKLAHYLE